MKNIISFLIIFVCISCSVQKNAVVDYSTFSVPELNTKKTALELEANYVLVNHYLEQIERGDISHMPLTKIDKGLIDPYWENSPILKASCDKWKEASANVSAFSKKYAPELSELGTSLRNKKITEDEYFKKNREYRAKLATDYPNEYPQLSEKHITSLKTMWKLTGRYMLEDHKNKSMLFPLYWIPEKDKENEEKEKKYRAVQLELSTLQKELIKKTSKS